MQGIQRFLFIVIVSLSFEAAAQEAIKNRPSPTSLVTARYKDTYLKITYSQPHKRGRIIFGSLVPFGQVWRTGANEATEMTITKDIVINNSLLRAGTYSIFTIPDKESWTIILNSELGLWGSYNYNAKLDVMRFNIPTKTLQGAVFEPFTILIEQKNNVADIVLLWDSIRIQIPIQFQEPKLP
ncbi:MAG: DUF2911 domain-containing protein [Flammeovirgaceae bacterium]|jgi:hypothetical protein|nr:DUF2911 domain-containing protein [Flammeovirgaceae bacterium]